MAPPRSFLQYICSVILLVACANALKFDLQATSQSHDSKKERCIRNFVAKDTLVVVTAIVSGSKGDGMRVNMHIRDAVGNEYGRPQDVAGEQRTVFTSHADAAFDVCFENLLTGSRNLADPSRHVELDIDIGADAKDWSAIQATEKLKPVEADLRRMEEMVAEIVSEMDYLRSREQKLRDTNESTNNRVKWFGLCTTFVLVALWVWQILYLRAYFRLVPTLPLDAGVQAPHLNGVLLVYGGGLRFPKVMNCTVGSLGKASMYRKKKTPPKTISIMNPLHRALRPASRRILILTTRPVLATATTTSSNAQARWQHNRGGPIDPVVDHEMQVGELEGAKFKIEPLRRTGEDAQTMRARLTYQSRKRGTLESDLLLSTFAASYLPTMSKGLMTQYDLFLDENDWDIYYWATQTPDAASAPSTSNNNNNNNNNNNSNNSELEPAQPAKGEWAQTIGTFKPAYRPVPARWRDSEVLALLRSHVKARSAAGVLGNNDREKAEGMAFMPPLGERK
ncbi:Endoplasmic reticulum vesicle protein 25 [Cytospora mali]|uniref:Succinate dehydrogenase assembly factor 2, mitochondrial n=1 Tax=Cytospora mali TaxID=578113 RepID=A0A194WCL3_CYTMA|nr:Endoplasmic reticulum vesicle protein 25 [Valsa mali]